MRKGLLYGEEESDKDSAVKQGLAGACPGLYLSEEEKGAEPRQPGDAIFKTQHDREKIGKAGSAVQKQGI